MAASTSARFDASGFSQITLILWLRKSCVWEKCREFGLAIYTASMASLSAIASSEVNRCSTEKSLAKCWACSRLREYTAVNLYLPLSWAASTNWRVIQFVPITAKRIITRGYSIKGFCRQCSTPFSSSTCADTHYFCAGQPCSLNGPIMTEGPRYFGWRWRILASITVLTRASFSRS